MTYNKQKGSFRRNPGHDKPAVDTSALIYGKVPPQALDMEEAVIAAMLLERDCIDTVLEILPSADVFYKEEHKKIYAAIIRLVSASAPVDLLTVKDALDKSGDLEMIGGAYALTILTQAVLSSAHVASHAFVVKEMHMKRQGIQMGGEMITMGYDNTVGPFDMIEHADRRMMELTGSTSKKDYVQAAKVINEVIAEDKALLESNTDFSGIRTGNNDLDALIRGWQPGELIIIAARPSVGKTAFALNSLHYSCILSPNPVPVAFFSLEMGRDKIIRRLVGIDSGVTMDKVHNPKLRSIEEQQLISASYARIAAAPFYIDDTPGLSAIELRAKARRMKRKHGVQLIAVDYLQLMTGNSERNFNREGEISQISRDLKGVAKELHVPMLSLCQLNRDIEKRASGEFKLSDLRESGGIEQDADLIGFLWRPGEEDLKADHSLSGIGKLDIKKHRNGETKKIFYSVDLNTQRWGNYENFRPVVTQPKPSTGYQAPTKRKEPLQSFPSFNQSPENIDDLPF